MPPLRLAHRGDHRTAPENSLEAFRAALALPGCDGVELDVRASADGVAVVLHDASLRRIHGRADRAADLSAGSLAAFGVPSLAAALAVLPMPAFVDVELKEDLGTSVVAPLLEARGNELSSAVISSFEPGAIQTIRRLRPAWPCWLNTDDLGRATITRALELGCVGVSVRWTALDVRLVEAARLAGLGVAAWTLRRRAEVESVAGLGLVAVCLEGEAIDDVKA